MQSMNSMMLPLEARLVLGMNRREYATYRARKLRSTEVWSGFDSKRELFLTMIDLLECHISTCLSDDCNGDAVARNMVEAIEGTLVRFDRNFDELRTCLQCQLDEYELSPRAKMEVLKFVDRVDSVAKNFGWW